MSNAILSLLVPNVTADKGEKPAGLLVAAPLSNLNDVSTTFKEVLAAMDRLGVQPKSLGQIRQDLQNLTVEAQQKFLNDMRDGLMDGNIFAGLAMPGVLPQVAQTKYHEIVAVVEVIPATRPLPEGMPVTPLPLDALTERPLVEDSVMDVTLPLAQSTALPVLSSTEEENFSAPLSAKPSEATSILTPQESFSLPDIPKIPTSEAQEALPDLSVASVAVPITENSAPLVPMMRQDPALVAAVQNPATAMQQDMSFESEAEAPADADAQFVLSESQELMPPLNIKNVKNGDRGLAEAVHSPQASITDVIEKFAVEETFARILPTRSEALPSGTVTPTTQPVNTFSAQFSGLASGFEPAEFIARAPEMDVSGAAPAMPQNRSLDTVLASNPAMITLQVRPDQPMGSQLRVHIKQAMVSGVDEISIRLMPESLGRIDVKIEFNADGNAQVRVMADKAETFDLLQRDARGLERALAEAGIKADSGSLQFQLRDGGNGNAQAQQGFSDGRGYGARDGSDRASSGASGRAGDDIVEVEDAGGLMRLVATTGLNIRV